MKQPTSLKEGPSYETRTKVTPTTIKPNQTITFSTNGNETRSAEVLSRAGKRTGRFGNWYNIEYTAPRNLRGKKDNIDIKAVGNLKVIEEAPSEADVYVATENTYKDAKIRELNSWKNNEVYEEVPYNNQKCISTRWICTLKELDQGKVTPKARLVARGFEEPTDSLQKDSPTCSKDTLRVMISTVASMKWDLKSIDIKTAFLQGENINRDVYLQPPLEANCKKGYIWKLKKCVYGLSDASMKWYERVKSTMINLGGEMSSVDSALFIWHKDGVLEGLIAVHVDDFLWAGSNRFYQSIIQQLRKIFTFGKEECKSFKYLGLHVLHKTNDIELRQGDYVDALTPIIINKEGRADNESLTESEKEQLRSKIGQLLWITSQTRPDISFDVSNLAINFNKATVKNLLEVNKAISKAKSDSLGLTFQRLTGPISITIFTDAAFGNLQDGGSQGAYLIFLTDEEKRCNLVSWQSKRIKRIVRSSLAAETLALSEGIDAALFISTLYNEIIHGPNNAKQYPAIPITAYTDNKSLYDALKSSKFVIDRRLRIDIGALRELVARRNVKEIAWIDNTKQLADALTKRGSSTDKLKDVLRNGHFLTKFLD